MTDWRVYLLVIAAPIILICAVFHAAVVAGGGVTQAIEPVCVCEVIEIQEIVDLWEDWQASGSECSFLFWIIAQSGGLCYDCGDGRWIRVEDLCCIPGDLNCDGVVDLADLAAMLNDWTGPLGAGDE